MWTLLALTLFSQPAHIESLAAEPPPTVTVASYAQTQRPDATIMDRDVNASNVDLFIRRMRAAAAGNEVLFMTVKFAPPEGDYTTFHAWRHDGSYEVGARLGAIIFGGGPDYSADIVDGLFRITVTHTGPNGYVMLAAEPLSPSGFSPNGPPNFRPDRCPDPADCGY